MYIYPSDLLEQLSKILLILIPNSEKLEKEKKKIHDLKQFSLSFK